MNRITKSFIIIFACAFTTISYAQTTFGLKGGLNIANVIGEDTEDLDSKTAFHVGATAEFKLSENFSLQTELLYSMQGAKYSEEGLKSDIKLNYLNLPIIAKYYVSESFSLEAGPQIGFKLNSEVTVEYEGESETEDLEGLRSIGFGVNFGLGFKLDSGLNFGARYNLGLSNINEDSDDGSVKNGVIQLSVGYTF